MNSIRIYVIYYYLSIYLIFIAYLFLGNIFFNEWGGGEKCVEEAKSKQVHFVFIMFFFFSFKLIDNDGR